MSPEVRPPLFQWNAVCVDCSPSDFEAVVAFYRDLLGLKVLDLEEGWARLRDAGDPGRMGVNVQAEEWYLPPLWPERVPAQTKMMHFEVRVDDVEAAVARAVSLGAREAVDQPEDRDPGTLRIMLDPAGHPFCLWS